jgi:putative membrane protein
VAAPGHDLSKGIIVSALLATATAVGAVAHPWGFGPGPWLFFLVPLFFFLVLGLIFALVGRARWRRFGPGGPGYGGPGWGGQGWQGGAAGSRSAEATLAERFAQGDIDEVEYRARLEVLRANRPS